MVLPTLPVMLAQGLAPLPTALDQTPPSSLQHYQQFHLTHHLVRAFALVHINF